MNKDSYKIYSEVLLDSESEVHYAWHKSLKDITIKHSHDFYEFFLITEGRVYHIINNSKILIEKGTLVFIRPYDVHYYQKFKDEYCELINIAFPKNTIEMLFDFLRIERINESLLKSELPVSIFLPDIELNSLINKISHIYLMPRHSKSEIHSYSRKLLIDIISNYFLDYQSSEIENPSWIYLLRKEMMKRENFVQGISRMQEISGKSKEHLSREYRKHFSKTPTQFINDLRLNYAANLLSNTDEKILLVSMEAGFENLSHFYHIFQVKYKTSPNKFRKSHKKIIIP